MNRFWIMCAALALGACVEDPSEPAADETDGGENVVDNDGGTGGTDAGEIDPRGDAQSPDAARPAPDLNVDPPPPPPPPEGGGCEAYCERLDECLAPACAPLQDTNNLCRNACRNQRDAALAEFAQLSCEDFNERLFESSDELRRFCDDSMPPPEGCDDICDLADMCRFPGGRDQCLGSCRAISEAQRECLRGAENCQQFGRCFQMQPPDGPSDAQRCEAFCNRQTQCVFLECAAGTLPDGFNQTCREACNADTPAAEEMQWVFDQLCPEVTAGVRQRHEDIDANCENDEDEVCALLCENTIAPCSDGVDLEGCEAECAGFDEANLVCLQVADNCGDVNGCFGDDEGQARCERYCEHLQGCLEEACPPRVIPPHLSVNCTAGCLDSPPEEMAVEEWEALACGEVRQTVYRRNRQLRPICEGGRDFRPSPDECAAFCDNSLQACIGVGGRNFCLAACASLTRDQYGCALAAQGDCAEIATCLEPVED